MMRIDVISAVPELLMSAISYSIVKRAREKKIVEINLHNLRDYAKDKHKTIDDKPFGGGAGMTLKPEPFFECIEKLKGERNYDRVIFPSPRGRILNQKYFNDLSLCKNIMIVCGHYKGIDERVIEEFASEEVSIGNFVLSGGELPAAIIIDAVVRLLPGALHDSQSALEDSFQSGDIIGPPTYTRPAVYKGKKAPEVLLSGNHKMIEKWKEERSKELTEKWKKINTME
jgi:tRNA (guanine37-N1)-methyltransferase